MKLLDRWLNAITMYRLLLFGLGALLLTAVLIDTSSKFGFSSGQLSGSIILLLLTSYATNRVFARAYGVATNAESALISALILACILPPPNSFISAFGLILASVLTIASKYILTFRGKHLFNPAASGAFLISLIGIIQPNWWIASASLLPFTLLLTLSILRKLRRWHLAGVFIGVVLIVLLWLGHGDGTTAKETLLLAATSYPIMFFAGVMLTEPLTMPATAKPQLLYAALIGLFFASRWSYYASPEAALLIGNLFAVAIGRFGKPVLKFKALKHLSVNSYEFQFTPSRPLEFTPGQYLELTLPHQHQDSRGNRRTFSIASSPKEADIRFGVRVHEPASSFKRALLTLEPGAILGIGAIAGDFTLPKNVDQKLVFLAGGIGITPFRSMLQSLVDASEMRNIILLQTVATGDSALYVDVTATVTANGVKTVQLHDRITREILQKEINDYAERTFYVSGPPGFVDHCRQILKTLGITGGRVVSDYFSGY